MPIISVDLQKDFTTAGGACFQVRPAVDFIKKTLIPHCRSHGIRLAEIISDYRQPRPGLPFAHCIPGTPGYESELSADVRHAPVWIKCMHSPVWVREHGGSTAESPGEPYPAPGAFSNWLTAVIGPPKKESPLILIGLTLDCCLLCTAQELAFRGYMVEFLTEAVDTYSGSQEEKKNLFRIPLANWGREVSWQEVRKRALNESES